MVYERSNIPVDPIVLERVMKRLHHRGPDGHDVCMTVHFAMGHWHFWTTPEEVGERQPLELVGLPFKVVMDGRLDNRPELIVGLNINPLEGSQISDAALVLHAYGRWGQDCFKHFIGEFALVILDQRRGEMLCGRDPLGNRTLFYSNKGTRIVVASEPWAAAGADGSTEELNEKAVACYFALEVTDDGQTLFRNVYELLPAHAMLVNSTGQYFWRYWEPDLSVRIRGKSDQEYAEGFLSLLEESVRCRMRANTPAGVLMSGGLDSTSVACLAARMMAPKPLTTISYVFDELPECDERNYIEMVKEKWGIHSIQLPCDDLWPYQNLQDRPRSPNLPDSSLYRMVKERAYQRAGQEGLRVLLTGDFGDELYDGEENWLEDLLIERRLREAIHEVNLHLRYTGLRQTWGSSFMRRVASRMFLAIPLMKQFLIRRLKQRQSTPVWLTPFAASSLYVDNPQLDPVFESRNNLLGTATANDCAQASYYTSRLKLELRHPYRDIRLVDYVLRLPAYQLYYHGQYKHVLRTAMQGILPEAIRTRSTPTSLRTLLERGKERERNVLRTQVFFSDIVWEKYVRTDWLMEHWENPIGMETDIFDVLVPWLCVTFASWYRAIINNGVDYV